MKKELILFLIIWIFLVNCVLAARLPAVGGDSGSWGTVLNDYLNNSLGENGTSLNVSSGNITLGQKLTFALGGVIDNLVSGWTRVSGSLNITGDEVIGGDLIVNNSDLYVNTTSGNVGVGTTPTERRLSVFGDASIENYLFKIEDDGFYIGGTKVSEHWVTSNHSVNWTARDSSRLWSDIAMSGNGRYQTAVVATSGQIYTSSDFGDTWTARASALDWRSVDISSNGKYQTAIVFGGQIYTSPDYGVTWTARDSSRQWLEVAVSGEGKYQTAVANDAGGGSGDYIYVSSDYGVTWATRDSQRTWDGVTMSNEGRYQTAFDSNGQIYTSSDYGNTWTARDSSRTWIGVAVSNNGKYQTAVITNGQMYISSDYGVTWAAKDSSRLWSDIAMSGSGLYQTATVSNGNIYVSSDYGNTWTAEESSRVWGDVAMSDDARYRTAVVVNGQIYVSYADLISYGNIKIGGKLNITKDLIVNNSDLYINTSSGRVGIGTSTPQNTLNVFGDLNVTGTSYLGNITIVSDNITANNILSKDGSLSLNNSLYVTSEGDVGVGTGSPSSKFDVNGNVSLNNTLYVINSGNVGIGTATPLATLDVNGNVSLNNTLYVLNSGKAGAGTNDPQVKFAVTGSNGSYTGSSASGIFQLTTGTGGDAEEALLMGIVDNSYQWIQAAKPGTSTRALVLQPGGGNVGIGSLTFPTQTLHVKGTSFFQHSDIPTYYVNDNATPGTYWRVGPDIFNAFVVYNQEGTGVYMADGATSWTANSDERLKKNIANLSTDKGLIAIMKLNPITYNWKDNRLSKVQQTGFIAQEVQEVFPEVVSHSPTKKIILEDGSNETIDNPLGISMTALIPNIVKAIHELNIKVDDLAGGNYTVKEKTVFDRDLAGTATIKFNETYTKVEFENNYSGILIVTLTPLDFIDGQYRVTEKSVNGFIIELQKVQGEDISFDWHAFVQDNPEMVITAEAVSNVFLDETVANEAEINQTASENSADETSGLNQAVEISKDTPANDTKINNSNGNYSETNVAASEDIKVNINAKEGDINLSLDNSEAGNSNGSVEESSLQNNSGENVSPGNPITGSAVGVGSSNGALNKFLDWVNNLF